MTENTENTQVAVAPPKNELRLSGPRLPYHPAIEERFGIDRGSWKFLTDVLYPTAEEPETVINVLAYCTARGLDVMKKPVHVVPVWDKKRKRMVDSIWPAISEVRITAMRTGEYVGKAPTVFGPTIKEKFGEIEVEYPEWAEVTVYRYLWGEPRAFVGERLRWKEFYAKAGRDTLAPNDMWRTKPFKQLAKCAEADALRAAFPEEAGTDQTAEEMDGQEVEHVYSSGEQILGSGVRARLEQQTEKPTEGFNAAALESLGDESKPEDDKPEPPPEKPKRGRPSKAEIAAREAAQKDPTPYTQPEPVQAVTELQSEPEEASEAEFTPVDPQDPNVWHVLDEIDGPAPRDEHYTLADDEPKDGKLPVYENGIEIGKTGPEDSGSYRSFTEHTPNADEDFPGDKPAPEIGKKIGNEPVLTGVFKAFWADFIETEASAWGPIKDALRQLQATQEFKDLTPAEQNAWRRLVGQAIATKVEADEFDLNPLDDITAFRLAVETWDDPETVVTLWGQLQETDLYKGLAENLQAALSKAVAERIAVLEAR